MTFTYSHLTCGHLHQNMISHKRSRRRVCVCNSPHRLHYSVHVSSSMHFCLVRVWYVVIMVWIFTGYYLPSLLKEASQQIDGCFWSVPECGEGLDAWSGVMFGWMAGWLDGWLVGCLGGLQHL